MIPDELKKIIVDWFHSNFLVIVIVALCVLTALASLIWLSNDNRIEEAAEKEIELLTGVKVDFTPERTNSLPTAATP